MESKERRVYDALNGLNIPYERIEHPPVYTCEEAGRLIANLEGVRTKSLFLKSRKNKRYYLVIMDDRKALNIKGLGCVTGDKGMSFASAAELERCLGLYPGSVSLFGILNDDEKAVRLLIDNDIFDYEYVSFHPNINTATLTLTVADMERFIESRGNAYERFKI